MSEFLFSIDTLWIAALIVGGFIAYQLRSGEIPLRGFGSIRRARTPILYWLFILFYTAILGMVVFAWVDGLRIPVAAFFE